MVKQAPTVGRLLTMVVFALSCFGLLLFLWMSFGGPVPLQSKGYRVHIAFNEATQLAQEADVRISGVSVGKVISTKESTDRTDATIELQPKYAPLPKDSRAILRLKTLLGETYVELTPGDKSAGNVPDNGRLPDSHVEGTVELDEVIRAFDPKTRQAFKNWWTGWAATTRGRGSDFNAALGNLGTASQGGADLLGVLDTERSALAHLIRNAGTTFGALGSRESATRALITSGNRVFAATGRRNADLESTLKVLPTFVKELRPTLDAVQVTAKVAAPVFRALRPTAPLLYPALRDTNALAPDLKAAFKSLGPTVSASRTGLPAATKMLKAADPLVQILDPVSRDLSPVVDFLGLYKYDFMQSWMNVAAATQATTTYPGQTHPLHYLRAITVINNDALMIDAKRKPTNRNNAYPLPNSQTKLKTGLDAYSCANIHNPPTIPAIFSAPAGCNVQAPFDFQGRKSAYPHVERAAP